MLYNQIFSKIFIFKFLIISLSLIFLSFYELFSLLLFPAFILLLTNKTFFYEKVSHYDFLNFISDLDHSDIVIYFCFLIFLVFVLKNLLITLFLIYESQFLKQFKIDLATKLFKRYLEVSYVNFIKLSPSELLRNVTAECEQVKILIHELFLSLKEIFVLITIFIFLFISNSSDVLIFFIFLISISLIFYFFIKNVLKTKGKLIQIFNASQIKAFSNPINSIRDTIIYNLSHYFKKIFSEKVSNFEKHNMFMNIMGYLPKIILEVIGVSGLVIVVYVLSSTSGSNEMFLTKLVLFAVCFVRFIPAFSIINSATTKLIFRKVSLDLINSELIKFNNKLSSKTNQEFDKKIVKDFDISIDNLSYKYPNTKNLIIQNLDLKIKSPCVIGIIGESGSGKTTFLDIFLGLLNSYEGSFKINNFELKDNYQSWQKNISLVSQKIYLLEDTIKNNIIYGSENFDKKLFKQVVNLTHLDKIIDKFPDLENSSTGHNGNLISGGQAQRIGIARALYKNKPILILDEATNALDIDLESKILKSIFQLSKKIVILVSHRKETLLHCDCIYEFKNKTLVKK